MKIPTLATVLALVSTFIQAEPVLQISSHDIRPESSYKLIFDHAVVKEEQLNIPLPNKLISIKPKLAGNLIWTARNTAEFIPNHVPQLGTEYTFSTARGQKYLDGSHIQVQKLASYSTQNFGPSYHRKGGNINTLPENYIRFNDDVDPKRLSNSFYYVDKEGNTVSAKVRHAVWNDLESSYYIRPSWKQRFQNQLIMRKGGKIEEKTQWKNDEIISNGVIVTPATSLGVGEDWRLVLKKGISNASRKAKTESLTSYYLWNIKPMSLISAQPISRADAPRELYLDFSSSLTKQLNNETISEFITLSPKPDKLSFKKISSSMIQVNAEFVPDKHYRLRIAKGFTARNGLAISEDVEKKITFHHVRSGIGLPTLSSAQLAKGQRKLSIETVNMKQLKLQIKSLNTTESIRAEQGYRHYSGRGHDYERITNRTALPFSLISGTTIVDKTIPLDNLVDTSKTVDLDWSQLLPADSPANATLFISVTGIPKDGLSQTSSRTRIAQSLIQLTDIGLAWKIADEKVWAYAYSLETGNALPGADVQMFGEDAKLLQQGKTDAQGIALIKRSGADRHLLVSHGSDRYFVPFDSSLDTVSMWRFPVDFQWYSEKSWQNDLLSFTDRNLYRPGDTVKFKGILREFLDNKVRRSPIDSVTVTLYDPKHRSLSEHPLTISPQGTFDLSIDLPKEKVGTYTLTCTLNRPKGSEMDYQFTHSFQVQEFRRNSFAISSHLSTPKPGEQQLQLDIQADYYQGAPVSEGNLKWYFRATPTGFYPENFRDYLFGDHRKYDRYYWSYYFGYSDGEGDSRDTQHSNGTVALNSEGSATATAKIPSLQFPTPQRLVFHSEVTDSRDQTLSQDRSITVHAANHYFGISRVDKLVRVNEEHSLKFVAVTTEGKTTDATATLTIEREYNESVKVLAADGSSRVHNETRREHVSKTPIDIKATKSTLFPFTPTQAGRYIFTLTGNDQDDNPTTTASSFYVYGSDAYPWATEDGIRIKIIPEQKSYLPGDTARLLVMTPIEGSALVTVERKGVITSYRRELTINKPVIEIPVEKGFAPNAYISVMVIRGSQQSPHKFKRPALKLGYCQIKVDDISKKLSVQIEAPTNSSRPGDTVTIKGTVTNHLGQPVKGAELVVYAEDEGTLAVMGYDTPRPLSHFHAPRPLTLRTGVSLSHLLTENPEHRYVSNKGFTIGGGAAFGAEGASFVKVRKNFDPCAAWFPTVSSDHDGRFEVSFQAPDTLTRYRVLAVAVHGNDKFGSATSAFVVNKDIMLEPKPPRFANQGDSLDVKVLVQNTSQFSGKWDIRLKTDSLCSTGERELDSLTRSIRLEPGSSVTLSFPVHFTNTGTTQWVWSATPRSIDDRKLSSRLREQLSDNMQSSFPIIYPRPLLRQAELIRYQPNHAALPLTSNINPVLINGRGHLDLEFSQSLLLEAGGAADYLLKYPYGCLEQTSSSMMPWLAIKDLKHLVPSFAKKTDEQVRDALQHGVDRILTMQTGSGGLAYWPGGEEPTNWATTYGGMVLILAQQQGAHVPDSALSNLTDYLDKFVKEGSNRQRPSWHGDSRARALYVLALAGRPNHSIQNKLISQSNNLTTSAKALLALAIHHSGGNKEDAIKVLTSKQVSPPANHWMRHRADIPTSLLAWSTIAPDDMRTEQTILSLLNQRNRSGHWNTTWVNGWAMHSLAAYAKWVEGDIKDTTITLETAEGTHTISLSKENPVQTMRIPLEQAAQLRASSNGKAYTRLLVSSKPLIAPSEPVGNNGLAIRRSYQRVDSKGNTSPLENPMVGDLVRVSLMVTFPNEMDYVVIDDPLPSTFEIVNSDFASQSAFVSGGSDNNHRVSRRELRNDRALFFLNRSWGNTTQELSYLARITASGTVEAPPAKAEAMYDPSRYALSEAHPIKISDREKTVGK